jgi:hypothetical protein
LYHSEFRIDALQFDVGSFGGETPINGCGTVVSVELSGRHFLPYQVDIQLR